MRILLFSDNFGTKQLLFLREFCDVVGLVCASIRPEYLPIMQQMAEPLGIPVFILPKKTEPNYFHFVEKIKSLNPELFFVNSFSMLLHPEMLQIPKFGSINVHWALLPEYRGANPLQWAIINNEKITGVTIHYMESTFDTGDIIAQTTVPIYFNETWVDVRDRLELASSRLIGDVAHKILAGNVTRTKQDESRARSWRRRTPEDGRIDWQDDPLSIYNLIRALVHPYPGAYYYDAAGNRVVIDRFLSYDQVVSLQNSILSRDKNKK